jgi:hypothetical protein
MDRHLLLERPLLDAQCERLFERIQERLAFAELKIKITARYLDNEHVNGCEWLSVIDITPANPGDEVGYSSVRYGTCHRTAIMRGDYRLLAQTLRDILYALSNGQLIAVEPRR